MSLISQKDRELTIAAFEHYADFLNSEISFIEENTDKFQCPEYQDYKSELYELNTLLNWIRLEYYKNDH